MPASPYSSNVILAKARAMYGRCLTAQDFHNLLACHSVSEIASYLKNRTAYAGVLADINESTIHRGHLESLLRRKLWNDYASLSRYDRTVGMRMSDYLIQLAEIQQILACLRLMSAGRTQEFFFAMPMFLNGHTHLDLARMAHSKNYAELLDALGNTPYRAILERFPPEEGRIPFTSIENALYTRLMHTLLSIVNDTKGDLHKELLRLCGSQIDAQNVSRILRLKTYFGADPDTIRSQLLPSGGTIPRKILERMLQASTADEVLSLFFTTPAGRQLPEAHRTFVHDLYHRVPYFNARHDMHFSIHPMVVLVSYVLITEVELDDIINVIEGIRYGLSPEEIKPMLVLDEH